MINVVLLSCDRAEYTAATIESFLRHNRDQVGERIQLWHCDDASTDTSNRKMAHAARFTPLFYSTKRVGVTEMVRRAARMLEHHGAEWMLLLENDWQTVRPIPWAVFDACRARGDVWALRLYGRFKERGEQLPAGARHRGRGGADPNWQEAEADGEPFEVGDIHWGNPPSIARVAQVAWLHKAASREKDAIARSGLITDKVARVKSNVVFHIGATRTPGFLS